MEVLVIASETKLTGRVIFKGEPGYEEARLNWNTKTNLPLHIEKEKDPKIGEVILTKSRS
jgi:hypothetical protein